MNYPEKTEGRRQKAEGRREKRLEGKKFFVCWRITTLTQSAERSSIVELSGEDRRQKAEGRGQKEQLDEVSDSNQL
ncbi:MAG: hypothetical protein F6K39_23815 [Okeania sp. SIO3B3]|nr:hypothetical protein [Okeania sp. SIO3B3]